MDKIRVEIMFDDHLVKNRPFLDCKISVFGQVAILQFFQREDPSLEIMFNDHLVKNRALVDYKKSLFGQVAIFEFFQRRNPMNLVES